MSGAVRTNHRGTGIDRGNKPPDPPATGLSTYVAPPSAAVIAGLLRLIAAGLEPIRCRRWERNESRIIEALRSGWWVALTADDAGDVVRCEHACPPSLVVPCWWRGCERDDWRLGADAVVIDPVKLLTDEQRKQLRERLEDAREWLAVEWWEPPVEDVEDEWLERAS